MSQDAHYLPRGAISVCSGSDSGVGTEYEAPEGELTDLPVCRYSGTNAGDSAGGHGANFDSPYTTQGKICTGGRDALAVVVI